jgi:adenylate cyclase
MGREIERKFLVANDAWRLSATGTFYRQGYLNTDPTRVVRVRTMGDKAVLTVKGAVVGATCPEFEYDIPLQDAKQLLDLCEPPLIEKTRYKIDNEGLVWEVDEFHGVNDGLVMAECELESENQEIEKPPWIGVEVTGDPSYYNSNLTLRPYSTW